LRKKLNEKITDLETDYDELKEKHDKLKRELEDLNRHIIQEHINGFQKDLRQAALFHKDIYAFEAKFDVNKDVVDGLLVNKMESSLEEVAEKLVVEVDANLDEAVAAKVDVKQPTT